MSRPYSSKSKGKNKKNKSVSGSPNSLASQLKQKNPEAFKKLTNIASEVKSPKAQPPQFLPGSLSSSTSSPSRAKKKTRKNSRRSKNTNLRNIYPQDKLQKHLDEVFGHKPSSLPVEAKKYMKPVQRTLEELFGDIDRTDSVKSDSKELSSATKVKLSNWAQAYKGLLEATPKNNDNPVDVIVGFDFGTSSAKIIVRFPYESEQPAFALPVPDELRSDKHPHCWRALLWIEPGTGQLSLTYKSGFEPITEIKTSAMQQNSVSGQFRAIEAGLTSEVTCVAYVGLMLRVIKGWLASDVFPKLNINIMERAIFWELNMGLPASKRDDKKIADRFNGIAKYAWNLSNRSLALFANDIHYQMLPNDVEHVNADISIRPEVVAQTVGFVQAEIADFGYYTTVDIGASTLDICTFNFVDTREEGKFNLFYSNVQLLGSESVNWIGIANQKFQTNFELSDLKKAIKACFGKTVITTKLKKSPNAAIWSSSLPVFLCGGGKYSVVHNEALSEYKDMYKSGTFGDLEFRDVAIPKNLEYSCTEKEYHRLSVAWGLSIQELHFNSYTMPGDIDDVDKATKIDITDFYIGAEQV